MSTRVLSLAKGGRKYVFRYSLGCEDQLLDQLSHLAERNDIDFDWLDAATLGFQITQKASSSTNSLNRPPAIHIHD